MNLLAHRGKWQKKCECNTLSALSVAFNTGLGIETDLRDLNGELVISHDMPTTGVLTFETMLDNYVASGCNKTLALNIKSDGLSKVVSETLTDYGVNNYFCFDMSVPDTLSYIHSGISYAARISEYEPESTLSLNAPVLWIDSFEGALPNESFLEHWLSLEKKVCLVSPELHGRYPLAFWRKLAGMPKYILENSDLMLCTDFPDEAQEVLQC